MLYEYQNKLITAGIGRNYTEREDSKKNKFNGKETKETYSTKQGIKLALPLTKIVFFVSGHNT